MNHFLLPPFDDSIETRNCSFVGYKNENKIIIDICDELYRTDINLINMILDNPLLLLAILFQ